MFDSTIVLDDNAGNDVTFKLIDQSGTTSRRRNAATTPTEPGDMIIKHSLDGKGPIKTARDLLSFEGKVFDSTGTLRRMTVNVSVARELIPELDEDTVVNVLANAKSFLTEANIRRWLFGES